MADTQMFLFQAKSKYRWNLPSCRTLTFHILIIFCSISLGQTNTSCGTTKPIRCVHGRCVESASGSGTCVCDDGWKGLSCDSCSGRARLTDLQGHISDGSGNYTLNTKCSWLIETGRPNVSIRLRFHHFATECSWDHLYIYDGNSVYSPLIAVLSGLVIREKVEAQTFTDIMTRSGSAYLHLYSDAAYNMSGFNITYRVDACPKDCSGRGTCHNGVCQCKAGWKGDGCQYKQCPKDCSGHGICNNNKCKCHPKYRGEACNVNHDKGVWYQVLHSNPPSGRASHKSVVVGDYMYAVAGERFGAKSFKHLAQPFQNLARFNFQTERWAEVVPASGEVPDERYGHTVVAYKNKLYMYGGVRGHFITDELWEYDIATNRWQRIRVQPKSRSEDSKPWAVSGHTAHVIQGVMYVFFGLSPLYGYVNVVQTFNLATIATKGNATWELVKTQGAIVKGGYGHSSVYDSSQLRVFLHGGYHSDNLTSYRLSDGLYSFEPRTQKWRILYSSGQYKYLHSAVIISGLMLVFGGNTHNDSIISQGAKCYSLDFLAYDLKCDKWITLEQPNLDKDISRFGHTAVVRDGVMYVFGGFNGLMLQDMYKYVPGKCEAFGTRGSCLAATPGVRCVWTGSKCVLKEMAQQMIQKKVITKIEKHECGAAPPNDGSDKMCPRLGLCPSCLSQVTTSYQCNFCNNKCTHRACKDPPTSVGDCNARYKEQSSGCTMLHNCHSCVKDPKCEWRETSSSCTDKSVLLASHHTCKPPCYLHGTCENCTTAGCMWCGNEQRCFESNSYVASFPYGQCMEWATHVQECKATTCPGLRTCDQCRQNPSCGWCDDGSDTGLGRCMAGGSDGPVVVNGTTPVLVKAQCPKPQWYFGSCPLCQCNGHSQCEHNSSKCKQCMHFTTGDQCEFCQDGYFGTATNGGNCTACQCNGQADTCNRDNGQCFCRTRGVKGDQCDICDKDSRYYGDPKDGGVCYYDLTTNYQFTFNFNKKEDKHYTQINFMNVPDTPDRDLDFNINCSGASFMNITVKSESEPEGKVLMAHAECKYFKAKFSHKQYSFGRKDNTTFYVYVYGFKTPFWLQISFSQFPKIDLVHFFVTFFCCFLSLMLIAAVLWKVKHRYDMFRRRQRMFVEMEQMASRPFSTCSIDVTDYSSPSLIPAKKEALDQRASRKKIKPTKPSPVTLEPLHGQKAAVLSLIIRMPMGDEDFTPSGQSGIAVGSALITLGHQRKASVDHKTDKGKNRKNPNASDNCI